MAREFRDAGRDLRWYRNNIVELWIEYALSAVDDSNPEGAQYSRAKLEAYADEYLALFVELSKRGAKKSDRHAEWLRLYQADAVDKLTVSANCKRVYKKHKAEIVDENDKPTSDTFYQTICRLLRK